MSVAAGGCGQWPVEGRPGLVGRDGDDAALGCTEADGLTDGLAVADEDAEGDDDADGDGDGSSGRPQMFNSALTLWSPPRNSNR